MLVVDLDAAHPDLHLNIAGVRHLGSEGRGVRQRIAFDPARVTAAQLLAAVSAQAGVVDLSIDEPDVEDVVGTLYRRG